MTESGKRKSLIIYASVTGNTEKVAMKFKQVFDKFGWQCDTLKVTRKTDVKQATYNVSDYDLLCIGGPIWGGNVPPFLYDGPQSMLGNMLVPVPPPPGDEEAEPVETPDMNAGWGPKKGIVFVTYGGECQGPMETQVALACLEYRLESAMIKCIGKFACCGGQWVESAADPVIAKFKLDVSDAVTTIARYKENPKAAEFENLSAEDRKMFEKAVKLSSEKKRGFNTGQRAWHWDFNKRPHERDLLKAEIFLSEILEDYYGGGVEMYPYSQYISIA